MVSPVSWWYVKSGETTCHRGNSGDGGGGGVRKGFVSFYRCRTVAVMRCHTSCCSWKTRPPFSTSAPLPSAPSVILHWWLSSVTLTFTWRARRSLHSLCTGQAPWVSHHGNPFTLIMSCELPSSFPNHPNSQKKKSWSTAGTLPAEEWLHRADRS